MTTRTRLNLSIMKRIAERKNKEISKKSNYITVEMPAVPYTLGHCNCCNKKQKGTFNSDGFVCGTCGTVRAYL